MAGGGLRGGMGKLFTRLIILILIGLVAYLYVQVVTLQKQNRVLATQAARAARLQSENAALKARLARMPNSTGSEDAAGTDWLSEARAHIQLAEAAVGRGYFRTALDESQRANTAVSNAAARASSESRAAVDTLRTRLNAVQTKAQALWHQFGG